MEKKGIRKCVRDSKSEFDTNDFIVHNAAQFFKLELDPNKYNYTYFKFEFAEDYFNAMEPYTVDKVDVIRENHFKQYIKRNNAVFFVQRVGNYLIVNRCTALKKINEGL